jgi:hypothetical protein
MNFQCAFGLDALERISAREYERWKLYMRINGPIHWKRADWNFANVIQSAFGTRTSTTSEFLLKFKRVKKSETDNNVAIVSAFGVLPQDDLNELREAAQIYD